MDNYSKNVISEPINLDYIVKLIKNNWLVFIGSLMLGLAIAYVYNLFSPKQYEVSTSLIINEESNGLSEASATLMQDIGFLSSDKNFINELQILKSTPLIKAALEKLNFQICYYKKDKLKTSELYKSAPFIVILNQDHPQLVNCKINVDIIDQNTCNIIIDASDAWIYSFVSKQSIQRIEDLDLETNASFGESISSDHFDFKILLNKGINIDEIKKSDYWFEISTDKKLVQKLKSKMNIEPPDIESTVAIISMKSTVPEKAIDYLNSLTKAYLNKEMRQKQHMAEKTIEYINSQLSKVSESLDIAEDDLQRFRSNKQVLDISMQAEQIFNELNDLKNEKARLSVNLKYVEYIQDYFSNNTQYTDLITPAAMGIEDPTLNSLIEELIRLNSEKASFIENNQQKSPYLQKINIRIDNLRSMISENISYIRRTTNIAIEDADSRIQQLNNEIRKMPETERELIGIERVFNINNNIYTYLLEKKSEAEIAKASYQPSIEIIEPADVIGGSPVAPRKNINYVIAFIFATLLPAGGLVLKDLLDNKINEIDEIERLNFSSIVGKIQHNNKKHDNIVDSNPGSQIAESFRMFRINLNYFLNEKEKFIISVTSTISGEGKSFISLNLATILAKSNFKTILLGFDIRKPKSFSSLEVQKKVGITEFISNQANIDDIIQKSKIANLDVIDAGAIPPNPSELIASQKTEELLNYVKDAYDYVIIDTPPIGIVTDGYVLMEKADLNVLVVRIKYTPKDEFIGVVKELKKKSLKSSLAINDIPVKNKAKYGYGYYKVT